MKVSKIKLIKEMVQAFFIPELCDFLFPFVVGITMYFLLKILV